MKTCKCTKPEIEYQRLEFLRKKGGKVEYVGYKKSCSLCGFIYGWYKRSDYAALKKYGLLC